MLIKGHTKQEIADKVGLSVRQIERIVYKNAGVVKNALELSKDLEKVNRILFIKNQMKISKKFNIDLEYSPMTLMDDLKEELEGSKPETLIDNSKHITNVTINKIDLDERLKLIKGDRCSVQS